MFRRQNKTRKRIMTTLYGVVGGVLAFLGIRALMNWLRQRSYEQPYRYTTGQGMRETEILGSNIPADVGAYRPSMPQEGVTATGRTEMGENYEPALQGERERESIPTTGMMTGMMDEQVAERPRERESAMGQEMVETDEPVQVGSLVGPLIVHLLSYHNMMDMLQRRRETAASAPDTDLPDVREGGADAISSLEAQLPEFDHAALVPGSLQERIFQLMDRIRDALQNMDYSEDQLFKIHDELRPAACKVLELIRKVKEDNVTGFEDVQKAYHCE